MFVGDEVVNYRMNHLERREARVHIGGSHLQQCQVHQSTKVRLAKAAGRIMHVTTTVRVDQDE